MGIGVAGRVGRPPGVLGLQPEQECRIRRKGGLGGLERVAAACQVVGIPCACVRVHIICACVRVHILAVYAVIKEAKTPRQATGFLVSVCPFWIPPIQHCVRPPHVSREHLNVACVNLEELHFYFIET